METLDNTTVTLRYDSDETSPSLSTKAILFGELVKLAEQANLTSYKSDLFHDALWVNEHIRNNPDAFTFGADESGTAIGFDENLVKRTRKHAWQVILTNTNGKIEAIIRKVQ